MSHPKSIDMKFAIGDKVLMTLLDNKEGKVIGWQINGRDNSTNIMYDVSYEVDHYSQDDYYPVKEYLGKKRQVVRINEKDLQPVVDKKDTYGSGVYTVPKDGSGTYTYSSSWVDKQGVLQKTYIYWVKRADTDSSQHSNDQGIQEGKLSDHALDAARYAIKSSIDEVSVSAIREAFYNSIAGHTVFKTPIFDKECQHSWKSYVGFTNSYEYCELCDIKKT